MLIPCACWQGLHARAWRRRSGDPRCGAAGTAALSAVPECWWRLAFLRHCGHGPIPPFAGWPDDTAWTIPAASSVSGIGPSAYPRCRFVTFMWH